MSQIYNKMRIDAKEEITDIITAKQNDSGSRFLDVYLYDGSTPIDLTGHEVRIYMRKPDGTEIFNNGEITDATAGRCQFELTDQALGAVGKLLCEISIWKDNVEILTTQTFDIFVTESLRSDGSIESSNEYGALVVLYQNLYEAIDLMQTMVEQFGQPGEVATQADINTFWRMLEYLYSVNDAALKNASVSEVLDRIGTSASGDTLFGAIEPLNELIDEHFSRMELHYEPSDDIIYNFAGGSLNSYLIGTAGTKFYSCGFLTDVFYPANDGILTAGGILEYNTDSTSTTTKHQIQVYLVSGLMDEFIADAAGSFLYKQRTETNDYAEMESKSYNFIELLDTGYDSTFFESVQKNFEHKLTIKKGMPVGIVAFFTQATPNSTVYYDEITVSATMQLKGKSI